MLTRASDIQQQNDAHPKIKPLSRMLYSKSYNLIPSTSWEPDALYAGFNSHSELQPSALVLNRRPYGQLFF